MKKALSVILLTLMLASLLCVGALADGEPTVAGLYGFSSTGNALTITPYTADGATAITAASQGTGYETFYTDAVRFDVTYENANLEAGEQCLLLVCSGEGAPSAENIVYINQKAAAAGSVTFDELDRAYPSKLGKGDYRIYVVSENSAFDLNAPTATFSYHVPYKLGDADGNENISVNDALYVLQAVAHTRTLSDTSFSAADADKNGSLSVNDALYILQAVAHTRTLE